MRSTMAPTPILHFITPVASSARACRRRLPVHRVGHHILQTGALDFLGRGQRQLIDESDPAGHLVVGHPIETPADDFLCGYAICTGALRDDECGHLVAAHLIGSGCYRSLPDQGVAVQDSFHLDGSDVFAGTSDHILLAVDKMKVTVGITRNDVAGVKPSALPHLSGRLAILQVFAKEAIPRICTGTSYQ